MAASHTHLGYGTSCLGGEILKSEMDTTPDSATLALRVGLSYEKLLRGFKEFQQPSTKCNGSLSHFSKTFHKKFGFYDEVFHS